MRYAIRALVVLAALAVLFLSPVVAFASNGAITVQPLGVALDLAALAAIAASLMTLRRRASL